MNQFFDDNDYFTQLLPPINSEENAQKNVMTDKRLKEAYKQAADIRKFEIELFWKRGTYYWAFILAAFTAHFALIGMIFSTFSNNMNKELSLQNMTELPGLSLLALTITAFFCFFFSLAWTLVNKGSKFWQKNWEAHIDLLEENITGKLYETFLNSNNTNKEFSKCPLCYKAYDYSVTKITTITSIVLTIVSASLLLFYIFLLFFKMRKEYIPFCEPFMWIVVPSVLIILAVLTIVFLIKNSIGNDFKKGGNSNKTWCQRSKNE